MNTRPEVYRAPSWSWASVDGPLTCDISFLELDSKFDFYRCYFISCQIQLKSVDNRFSEVLAGSLKIRGVLRQAWWNPVGKSIFWVDENDETPGAIQEALFRADSRRSSSKQAEDDESVPYYSFRAQHDESGDWPPMQVFFIPILAHEKTVSMGLLLIKSEKKTFKRVGSFRHAPKGKFDHLPQLEITIT